MASPEAGRDSGARGRGLLRRMSGACLRAVDELVSQGCVTLLPERRALVVLLFHAVFADDREAGSGVVDPRNAVTVDQLRAVLEYFRGRGFGFASPRDLGSRPADGRSHVLLTFDDGYANNRRILPLLRRYGAPAIVFVSTGPVKSGRAFWWDVVYRERRRRGASLRSIAAEQRRLKSLRHGDVDRYLRRAFGEGALAPEGDLDRPLTPGELAALAREPEISIGNHTRHHAILTRYPPALARAEIAGAQADLWEMTGAAPKLIAYPNGNVSDAVLRAARACGLELGITTAERKNRLPLAEEDRMRLGRFTLRGDRGIERQCRSCRSDVQLAAGVRRWLGATP